MIRPLPFLIALSLLAADPSAQQMGGTPPPIEIRDEGVSQGRVLRVDCVGAAIDCTVGSGTATVTISGGDAAAWGAITGTLSDQTDLQTALDAKEPADAAIQAHIVSAHAPANAQKNSDITKAEIEAVLTGEISSHSHAGGSGAETATVSVDFGSALSSLATVTVTGETWVTASSRIVCQPQATDADGQTVENYLVTPFHPTVSALVEGDGFDLTVLNPTSAAGVFRFSCTGA